ncbi:hypothetical protein KIH13_16605 [Pseudomonas viridiflava]|nr:hypothetical protein KIH13_16605 [Pseudomonas viridiflava]
MMLVLLPQDELADLGSMDQRTDVRVNVLKKATPITALFRSALFQSRACNEMPVDCSDSIFRTTGAMIFLLGM